MARRGLVTTGARIPEELPVTHPLPTNLGKMKVLHHRLILLIWPQPSVSPLGLISHSLNMCIEWQQLSYLPLWNTANSSVTSLVQKRCKYCVGEATVSDFVGEQSFVSHKAMLRKNLSSSPLPPFMLLFAKNNPWVLKHFVSSQDWLQHEPKTHQS